MKSDYATFEHLLHDPHWFATFLALSEVVLDRGPLERWVARGYFATLVAGAVSAKQLAAHHEEAVQLVGAYLADGFFLGDPSPTDRRAVISQVLPAADYTPQYGLDDIVKTLRTFQQIAEKHPGKGLLAAVREGLFAHPSDPEIATVAQSVVCLWYVAALIDLSPGEDNLGFPTKTAPIQTYGAALVWPCIGASPQGLPGPYYGDWAYPPPQPLLPPPSGRNQ